MTDLGKLLLVLGGVIVVAGGVLLLAGRFNLPLGRLPGDIVYRGKILSSTFLWSRASSSVWSYHCFSGCLGGAADPKKILQTAPPLEGGGFAQKARDLLEQVNQELKQAVEASNENH